jgi:hypothetical protein
MLKVQDIISNLKESQIDDITSSIKRSEDIVRRYTQINDTSDLESLEALKKELNGELMYLTNLYGIIRKFKGTNHVYFEDVLKRVKAEAIDIMTNSIDPASGKRFSTTSAELKVYQHPYYVERLDLIMKLRQAFIRADEMHSFFNTALQSIIQSVSVAAKEYTNQKATGNGV